MGSRFVRMLAAVALTGGLAAAGSAAFASSGSAQSAPNEFFTTVSTSQGGQGPGTIVASGVFHDVGVINGGANVDTVVFPDGTFKIRHNLPGGTINVSINPLSCVLTLTGSNVPFVLKPGSGTGAYRGISGSGTVQINGHQIEARNPDGTCSRTPISGVTVVHFSLHVSFGG